MTPAAPLAVHAASRPRVAHTTHPPSTATDGPTRHSQARHHLISPTVSHHCGASRPRRETGSLSDQQCLWEGSARLRPPHVVGQVCLPQTMREGTVRMPLRTDFEAALARLEADLDDAVRSGAVVIRGLKRAKRPRRPGRLATFASCSPPWRSRSRNSRTRCGTPLSGTTSMKAALPAVDCGGRRARALSRRAC